MALEDAVKSLSESTPTRLDVLAATVDHIPEATGAFFKDVYQNPVNFAEHTGMTVAKSLAIGALVGYAIPARGPAAAVVAMGFTLPMAYNAIKRVNGAYEETQKGADLDQVASALAKDSVSSGYDFALNMAGGGLGTGLGVKAATSESALAVPGQLAQRAIMQTENVLALKAFGPRLLGDQTPVAKPVLPLGKITTLEAGSEVSGATPSIVNNNLESMLEGKAPSLESAAPKGLVEKTGLAARLEQHKIVNMKLDRFLGEGQENQMYFGSFHGHSNRSDGEGEPIDLYKKAAEEGQQITTLTEHNHLAARGGVSPDDPRAKDEANVPIIASAPIEYAQEFADAAATTTDTHLSLVGTEIGTIGAVGGGHAGGGGDGSSGGSGGGKGGGGKGGGGKGGGKGGGHGHVSDGGDETPTAAAAAGGDADGSLHDHDHDHDHDLAPGERHSHGMMSPERVGATNPGGKPFDLAEARAESNAAAHIGGVNHIGLLEVPTFFETVRQPAQGQVASLMRAVGIEPKAVVTTPDVVKINDGDYLNLVNHLDGIKASDGGSPIIALNHPRYLSDENPNTPAAFRGRDYGQKSFANQQEWLDRFATPYVRQIELIKGGALNPNPVDTVPAGMIDPKSFAGYIDKGVHASPSFGRDFHFGDPVGNPGATGVYAPSLGKSDVLNALRQRRTIATTSSKNLSGVLTANDNIMMGAIVDHSTTPSLNLKMRVDGVVDPAAKYSVKLWGDTNIGDGKLAEIVQQKDLTGAELMAAKQFVLFDQINGTVGQNSAYYVEVQRTDATSNNLDRMWTAPIWLENLAGTKHSTFSKMAFGQYSQFLPNPFQSKIGAQ